MGPHTFNFAEDSERAQAAGAALRVATMEDGVREAAALAADPVRRADHSARAVAFAAAHRGAAALTADALLALAGTAPVRA
jgi:3-deoxy-D-manno-octulosonic-acid transferase